ncbi:MAG: diacylglycerol kinase family protein [Chloroflexota bacterium]
MPSAWLLYNPGAGKFPSQFFAHRAASVLRSSGWNVHLFSTESSHHITQLTAQAVAEKVDAVLMSGGDGSVNYALRGLIGAKTALGVLPSGTSNVWARELGLPILTWTRWQALEKSAQALTQAEVMKVDVGLCNSIPFLLWAGLGLDGFVANRVEPRQRWERSITVPQYAALVIWRAAVWHGMNLRVDTDNQKLKGHFLLAVVSNIRKYAGGLAHLSPQACLNDGAMDLWLFAGESLGETVRHAYDLWNGRHVTSTRVHSLPIRRGCIQSETPIDVQLDGEPAGCASQITIEVLPKALHVLVPPSASPALFAKPTSDTAGVHVGK